MIYTYQYLGRTVELPEVTELTDREIQNLSEAVSRLGNLLDKYSDTEELDDGLLYCSVHLYNPHKTGSLLVLSIENAILHTEEGEQLSVGSELEDRLTQEDSVHIGDSQDTLSEVYNELVSFDELDE